RPVLPLFNARRKAAHFLSHKRNFWKILWISQTFLEKKSPSEPRLAKNTCGDLRLLTLCPLLEYLRALRLAGTHSQFLQSRYLEVLVPIQDILDTLPDRQLLLIIVSFVEMDAHIILLRDGPAFMTDRRIEPLSERLQAEADENLQDFIRTYPERYMTFHYQVLNEYTTLLIQYGAPEEKSQAMDVLLQLLVNVDGSELGSDNSAIDACSICQDEYLPADNIIVLPCHTSHHFHRRCIRTWLLLNLHCPICRATPNLPGEDHAGATDEPLDYLGAVVRSGAITRSGDNIQMFPYNYLEILVPIEDLIDTLNDRQQLLIMIYFLEVDTHIFSLRHTPQNQVPIEQPSDRLQAEADEALRALIMTDPQRYTDFYVELMNEYLTLLIHSEDPEDRLMGMEVLLQHLVNINGSQLGSDDPTSFLAILPTTSIADASKLGYTYISIVLTVEPPWGLPKHLRDELHELTRYKSC
ncbi:hypothetical protein PSTT_06287, partial [Puccinia striiformis]